MDKSASSETEYNKVEYKNVEIKESKIVLKEFNSCTFIKCNFSGTYFQRCHFRDCTFVGCDLSLVNLKDSSFSKCRFVESKLTGINWTQSEWATGALIAPPVNFQGCVINFSSFMGLNLEKVILNRCVAHEVSFEDTNLSYADCTYTDFKDSRFIHTNLTGTDLRGAKDYQIVPIQNTLKRTKFTMPEAMSLLYNLDVILDDVLPEEV